MKYKNRKCYVAFMTQKTTLSTSRLFKKKLKIRNTKTFSEKMHACAQKDILLTGAQKKKNWTKSQNSD